MVYVRTPFSAEPSSSGGGTGDVFIFDYGCIVMWALEPEQELEVLRMLLPCQVKPLLTADVQVRGCQDS